MKTTFVFAFLLLAGVAQAQTVPFDPSAPVRGGSQNQTAVPPLNPALNESTIQGPPDVQRTLTNRDAQPSRLPTEQGFPAVGTPETSPTAVPDVREQPLTPQRATRRQSSDIVPTRSPRSNSSNIRQNRP